MKKRNMLKFKRKDKPKMEVKKYFSEVLATDRTALANERTFLAYLRTFIVTLSSGIAILKLEFFSNLKVLGIFLTVIAPFFLFVGLFRFLYVRRKLIRYIKEKKADDEV